STIKKRGDGVSSVDTEHEMFIQGGVGLGSRIEMPYLRTLLFNDRNFRFTKAILEIMPVNPSLETNVLPPGLSAAVVDVNNRVISAAPFTGRLIKDYDLGRNTHYEIDVTNFVNAQIQNDLFNTNALMVTLDDATYHNGVNVLRLGDQHN